MPMVSLETEGQSMKAKSMEKSCEWKNTQDTGDCCSAFQNLGLATKASYYMQYSLRL